MNHPREIPAARRPSRLHPDLVTDEIDFLRQLVPLAGARLVELGCGKADLARKLLARGMVASVDAFEVDERQHAANLASAHPSSLRFIRAGAEAVPLSDACCDGVLMLKSLHHVPLDALDRALAEVHRILVPGGWLYVSEPVYAGPFNEIMKLVHDEGTVRAAAYAALERAADAGVLAWQDEIVFDTPLAFRDFDDFVDRMLRVTYSDLLLSDELMVQLRQRFAPHLGADGARFVRQMRVNLMRKQ
jgi:SAM-dependent methyltransferase